MSRTRAVAVLLALTVTFLAVGAPEAALLCFLPVPLLPDDEAWT